MLALIVDQLELWLLLVFPVNYCFLYGVSVAFLGAPLAIKLAMLIEVLLVPAGFAALQQALHLLIIIA